MPARCGWTAWACPSARPCGTCCPPLLAHAARLVLDADALNAIAAEPALAASLRARSARGRATILTPHPLEAARLLGCSAAEVQQDRVGAARLLVECHGAMVVLKGSGSVIAAPGARPFVNPTGNGALASGGCGPLRAARLVDWLAAERPPVG